MNMDSLSDTSHGSWPLSPEQRAMAAQGAATARHLLRIDIDGGLDPVPLRAAVAQVLGDHGILRAVVGPEQGYRGLRQRLDHQRPPFSWQEVDVRGAVDSPTAAADWLASFAACTDVNVPVQVALLRVAEARHVLGLAVPMLLADRASLRVLAESIGAACRAAPLAGDRPEVFQYEQFVAWRQELQTDGQQAAAREAWAAYLGAEADLAPPRLPLRSTAPSAAGDPSNARRVVSASIDPVVAARAHALAESLGLSVGHLYQAAWWLTLSRLVGHQSFVGGWQHDCRDDYDVMQGAVGVFEKVLPLRIEVGAGVRVSDWLRTHALTADRHVEGQEYFAVEAPPTGAHLTVGCVVQPLPVLADDAWRVTVLPGPMPCFELALAVDWAPGAATLSLHGRVDCYGRPALERMLAQCVTVLADMIDRPEAPVAELRLVGTAERTVRAGDRGPDLDVGAQTLVQRVSSRARTHADAPALEGGARRWTCEAFDAQARALAGRLVARGVRPGDLVALDLPRSPELVIALFGVWHAGAAYVPMEPAWPDARRMAVLADARPALVIQREAAPDRAAGAIPHVVWDDLQAGEPAAQPLPPAPTLRDLAYVLYTSGSTGEPKGVMIDHGALLNYVSAASLAMDLSASRRWALTSSVVADLGNTALFGALFNGACLVVADDDQMRDAEAFSRFVRAREIDALKIVPSHLDALLEGDSLPLPATIVLGGEAVSRSLVQRLLARRPDLRLFNHYGPTETTVGVAIHRCTGGEDLAETMPLTQVLANTRVHVLDDAMDLAPTGALGQVWVGGAQVCRGYLNRDGAGVFAADPFGGAGPLYRTGDLAVALPEGGLRLVGRADHQVKVRGFRVEPAEVEAALLAQPGVTQALVAPRTVASGALELVAWVTAEASRDTAAWCGDLRRALATVLPGHMVPASISCVPEFPRLPNGKVDRLALTARVDTPVSPTGGKVPSDPLEFVLAASMGDLLGRAPLAADDDFFDLGAHSMMVIKLVARVRKLLKAEVAPALVFDHATAASLAVVLRDAGDSAALDELARPHAEAGRILSVDAGVTP